MKFLVAVLGIVGLIAVVASRDANAYTYYIPKIKSGAIYYQCGVPGLAEAVAQWHAVSDAPFAGACTNFYPNISVRYVSPWPHEYNCTTRIGTHPDLRIIECNAAALDPAINPGWLTVLTHEVGHALGLGHSADSGAIMNAMPCTRVGPVYTNCNTINADDIAGVRSLYGPFAGVPTATPTRQCF